MSGKAFAWGVIVVVLVELIYLAHWGGPGWAEVLSLP